MENQLFGKIESGVFGSKVSSAEDTLIPFSFSRAVNELNSFRAFSWAPSLKPFFWKALFSAVCSLNPKQTGLP